MSATFPDREFSFVQLKILAQFIQSESLRYSEAQPSDVDNDLYKYHLGFLVEKGVLEKRTDRYFLTDYGKYLTQSLDVFGNPKQYFKASVLPYVVNNDQILMQKRGRHPYFGDIETVSGKIHPGEDIEAAANRKLQEETGLSAKFKFIGIVRKVRTLPDGSLFEDTFYHICLGQDPTGELITKNEFGENFWVPFAKAHELVKTNATYGQFTEEILTRAEKKNLDLFYFTEKLTLPST